VGDRRHDTGKGVVLMAVPPKEGERWGKGECDPTVQNSSMEKLPRRKEKSAFMRGKPIADVLRRGEKISYERKRSRRGREEP